MCLKNKEERVKVLIKFLNFVESFKSTSKNTPTKGLNTPSNTNTLEGSVKSVAPPKQASKEKVTNVGVFEKGKKVKDEKEKEVAKMPNGKDYYAPYNTSIVSDGRYINKETGEIYGKGKNANKDSKAVDFYNITDPNQSKDVLKQSVNKI